LVGINGHPPQQRDTGRDFNKAVNAETDKGNAACNRSGDDGN